jgi:hypothetical protein
MFKQENFFMPSLKFETSAVLSQAQEQALALEIGNLASAMLNKPLSVVQVRVESGVTVAFGGEITQDSAFLCIALIGAIAPEVKKELPAKFAELFAKYGINSKRLFLNYQETEPTAWGWL